MICLLYSLGGIGITYFTKYCRSFFGNKGRNICTNLTVDENQNRKPLISTTSKLLKMEKHSEPRGTPKTGKPPLTKTKLEMLD